MRHRTFLIIAGLAACSPPRAPSGEAATLVLRNGHIVTVDSARPEAEAVAIRGATILAVGSNAEIGRLIGDSTEVLPQLLARLERIDLFHHDSLHSYEHMMWEYNAAFPRLHARGVAGRPAPPSPEQRGPMGTDSS